MLTIVLALAVLAACLAATRVLNQLALAILFVFSLLMPLFVPYGYHQSVMLASIGGIHLGIALQFDALSWLMLCLVSFISLMIHSYAARYLLSDSNQSRFMMQLSLLTGTVCLLIISGSLFTAFVAWQLIGVCLYLLLNHYHYDVKANKAAKKKFMINRLGDICFLIAVILTFQHYHTTNFNMILRHWHDVNYTILGLIFIAVMAKSAQFPFYLWLIDTMEAPTPVSALMHAGVINAGGFLLARLSPWYAHTNSMLVVIFIIGLITAMLGAIFMITQIDVKRQLAYSTMAQMGYMILQCGLGCFSSAVFHLIAHGFFKSSAFLASGGTLKQINVPQKTQRFNISNMIIATVTSVIVFAIGYGYFHQLSACHLLSNLLWLFIAITLFDIIYGFIKNSGLSKVFFGQVILLLVIFLIYLFILNQFIVSIHHAVVDKIYMALPWWLIILITAVLLFGFIIYQAKIKTGNSLLLTKLYHFSFSKGHLEQKYRHYIINPLRYCGDKLLWALKLSKSFKLFLILVVGVFTIGQQFTVFALHAEALIYINLVLLLLLLVAANRESSLNRLLYYLFFIAMTLANLVLSIPSAIFETMNIFHLINLLPLMLVYGMLIYKRRRTSSKQLYLHNRLPWTHFYLSVLLMLLIGIPGTASFVTEYYIFKHLLGFNLFSVILFAAAIWLLALIVLHTLQVHFFNPDAIRGHITTVAPWLHIFCIVVILFNVFNGVYPNSLLHYIHQLLSGVGHG